MSSRPGETSGETKLSYLRLSVPKERSGLYPLCFVPTALDILVGLRQGVVPLVSYISPLRGFGYYSYLGCKSSQPAFA